MAYEIPSKKPYRIEYGKSVYYKSSKKGETYHLSRPLTEKQAKQRLEELNKKYDYTTLFKNDKVLG